MVFGHHRKGALRSGAGTRRKAFQEDRDRSPRFSAKHVRTTPKALEFLILGS